MNQFYVVLPSDSSMNYFPDNTVAHYKTKLAHPICFDGDYEVALTELIYPMNYHNFIPNDKVCLSYPPGTLLTSCNLLNWELQSGYFKSVEELVDFMNDDLLRIFKTLHKDELEPFFRYDNKHISFKVKNLNTNLNAYEAGLSRAFINQMKINVNDPFELAFHNLMYVYSDIVDPFLVGDVQTPLLRAVALKGERGEMISEVFHNPYYLPVARRRFDTIEININTELGEPMPFADGKSVAVLHFKK